MKPFSAEFLILLGKLSVVMFVGSLLIVPLIIIFMPADYFLRERHWFANGHPLVRLAYHLIKNALGVVLLLAGIVMLFVPGQGLLTILVAVMLLEFPGKKDLERRLVSRPAMIRTLNRIRSWAGRPPLQV